MHPSKFLFAGCIVSCILVLAFLIQGSRTPRWRAFVTPLTLVTYMLLVAAATFAATGN